MQSMYLIVNRSTGEVLETTSSAAELERAWKASYHDHEDAVALTDMDEVCKLSLSALVKCYNHVAGTELKKFESKEAGARRLMKFLNPTMKKEDAAMATRKKASTKKTTAKKAATKKAATKKAATKKAAPRKPTADDGAATSVAATFRKYIIGGLDKETTLKMVRKAFPDRDVPDSYYAWYKNDCKKKGLVNEDS